jgi:hypothetical protein
VLRVNPVGARRYFELIRPNARVDLHGAGD